MKTIAILFVNYGPYHIARVTALAATASERNFRVIGIELARQELEYPWIANTEQLPFPLYSLVRDQSFEKIPVYKIASRLISLLEKLSPDAIAISGYFRPAMLFALFWSQWKGKIAVLFSETTEDDEPRVRLKEQIKSWLIGKYQSALVGGKPHQQYLIKLGMAKAAIFTGYDVVGNDTFHPDKIRILTSPYTQPYFLAINRFVTKKNLSFLIDAYAAYRQATNQEAWDLVLCGDGELRPQLKQQITKLGLQNCIHLPGFLQQEELLPYFAHAKCFIHASIQEQWGLVVNEAMAAGLPVLVSHRCGCFEDLIVEGVNGFGFDPTNQQQLTNLMLKVTSGEVNLEKIGEASLEHIQKFSPGYFAKGLMDAVEYALAHRK